MKNNFSDNNIEKFYEQFKRLPAYYELEMVHQLIYNPNAKAKWRGNYKPLKIIVMTSIFITGITILSFWLSSLQTSNKAVTNNTKSNRSISQTKTEQLSSDKNVEETKQVQQTLALQTTKIESSDGQRIIASDTLTKSTERKKSDCSWPSDTVLDKNNLFVHLTKEEQEKIGLFYKVDSTKKPQMDKFDKLYKKGIYIGLSKSGTKNYILYINASNAISLSNLTYTDKRWDSPFYTQMDTLIPVVVEKEIFWYLAIPPVLDSLPYRYSHLKRIYANLKCLKKQYPDKQLINYLDKKLILENINCLELSREELANIGVLFDSTRNGFQIVDVTTKKRLYFERIESLNSGEKIMSVRSSKIYSPNLPLLSTDEKGLNQHYFLQGFDQSKFRADLLLAIKIPLDKYLNNNEHSVIYWYNPTDSFINLLPDRIRFQLKAEKENILSNQLQQAKTCTYFEVCKSTLRLDDYIIYPNPAKSSATVKFSLSEKIDGSISLISFSGTKVKVLLPETTFQAGSNSYNINLEGVTPGIYLVSVFSNKGFKTQRLIISQ